MVAAMATIRGSADGLAEIARLASESVEGWLRSYDGYRGLACWSSPMKRLPSRASSRSGRARRPRRRPARDEGRCAIYPALQYADTEAAREWLSRAFGFEEHVVYRNDEGAINHGEMSLGPSMIMFGQGEPGRPGIYVAVEDADAHYARAKAAGAEITREIEDTYYGSREYTAKDVEGHVWSFGTYWPKKGDPPVT